MRKVRKIDKPYRHSKRFDAYEIYIYIFIENSQNVRSEQILVNVCLIHNFPCILAL